MKNFSIVVSSLLLAQRAGAIELMDIMHIGAAYSTHLLFHEMGHHILAYEVNAENHKMAFFVRQNGKMYPGLSMADSIPKESVLPYAAAGDQMAGITFEYGLQCYRRNPTTFNKALMLFSTTDFLIYTILGNYINDDNEFYDTNIIRQETGCNKTALLSVALAKTMLNTYRIMSGDDRFIPMIQTGENWAAFVIKYSF
ncbi:MAG: hypothetical protein ACMUJM_09005 [bacterium]